MTADYADTQAIRELLDQYFQAVGQADIEKLREISLPEASMYAFLEGRTLLGTPEPFYAYLAGRPSMVEQKIDCSYVVKNIQISGRIAAASAMVDGFYSSISIKGFFHFIRLDNGWRVASSVLTSQ